MRTSVIKKIRSAPQEPGVYIFYEKQKPLYVGKAANLRARLRSYLKAEDIKTQSLHEEATRVSYTPLRSEIEALIEESRLIKELKPKYNILWKDDKSYHYVAFTKEKFPKIFITHKNLKVKNYKLKIDLMGPFTEGAPLRKVMRMLRRYFPYCTCLQTHLRDCLNAQIGQCFGFCCKVVSAAAKNKPANLSQKSIKAESPETAETSRQKYLKNIKTIKAVLSGNCKKILKNLKDEREREALKKIFEHRDFVQITSPAVPDADAHFYNLRKIECYDMSNLAGKEPVGAYTVFKYENGAWVPDKNEYRKFKIKSVAGNDDPRMIEEVISRRLKHPEWPYPDLMIIDGGITQYRAAMKALSANPDASNKIKIISFAKPKQMIYGWGKNPIPLAKFSQQFQQLVKQAVHQTHNFVLRYHRYVRSKKLLN